jgi:hypothetical protein
MIKLRAFSVFLVISLLLGLLAGNPVAVKAQQPEPPAPLILPAGEEVVPEQYIVVYKPGALRFETRLKAQARVERLGGKMQHYYSRVLNGYSAMLTPEALEAVRSDPAVAYVVPDGIVWADQEPVPDPIAVQLDPPSWGIDRVDQQAALPHAACAARFGWTVDEWLYFPVQQRRQLQRVAGERRQLYPAGRLDALARDRAV